MYFLKHKLSTAQTTESVEIISKITNLGTHDTTRPWVRHQFKRVETQDVREKACVQQWDDFNAADDNDHSFYGPVTTWNS